MCSVVKLLLSSAFSLIVVNGIKASSIVIIGYSVILSLIVNILENAANPMIDIIRDAIITPLFYILILSQKNKHFLEKIYFLRLTYFPIGKA